jgi:hypothetical protein
MRLNLIAIAIALILSATPGWGSAQQPRNQPRLTTLKQLNALQQQQLAVQAAAQQTTSLVQKAYRNVGENYRNASLANTRIFYDFQAQIISVEIALQQTSALMQSSRSNRSLAQTAVGQLTTLQLALQQSLSVQGAMSAQSNALSAQQLQTLFQEQSSLSGLLTSPPLLPNRRGR